MKVVVINLSTIRDKWMKSKIENEKKGLPVKDMDRWYKEDYKESEIERCIDYLNLNSSSPNRGTESKKEITKEVLRFIYFWNGGNYVDVTNKLSTRLGLTPRTIRENYLEPLRKEGIIRVEDSRIVWVGQKEEVSGNAEEE